LARTGLLQKKIRSVYSCSVSDFDAVAVDFTREYLDRFRTIGNPLGTYFKGL